MAWCVHLVLLLFVALIVLLHYNIQTREEGLQVRDYFLLSTAATAPPRPPLLQPPRQVTHNTLTARSMASHTTSQTPATAPKYETSTAYMTTKTVTATSATTESIPSTSPIIHTLVTTQVTPSITQSESIPSTSPIIHTLVTTQVTPSITQSESIPSTSPIINTLVTTQVTPSITQSEPLVTEATLGPSAASHSQPPPTTPPPHTTEGTTESGNQTSIPTTLSTTSSNSTTSQTSTQPTHFPGTSTATHNATQTVPPAPTAPGPTLAPQPSASKIGIYQVLNGSSLCIKAELGIGLIVQDKESVFSPQKYFNINPNGTQASGNCGPQKSNLLLTFQGGFVNFTFTKGESSYYISEVEAYLTVSHPEATYHGMKSALVLFETTVGHSFKCVSEQSLKLSAQLQLKTTNVQLQAFDFEVDNFGNVDECASDYTIVLPVIVVVLCLCALGLIVYGIRFRRGAAGYQRI